MTLEECSTAITELRNAVNNISHESSKEETTMDNSLAMLLGQNNSCNNTAAMWNNPWIYFVWMMMFARNGLWGENNASPGQTTVLESLGSIKGALQAGEVQRTQLANEVSAIGQNLGFSKDLIYNAVLTNGNKIAEAVNALQAAMCNDSHQTMLQLYNIGTQIQQGNSCVTNAINAAASGINTNIMQMGYQNQNAITQLGCQTGKAISDLGFGLQSSINNSTNGLQNAITQSGFNTERGFCNLSNNMERGMAELALNNEHQTNHIQNGITNLGFMNQQGFNDIKYTLAKEACDTRATSTNNKNEILNWLTQDRINDLQDKLNIARTELATQSQTETLKDAIWASRYFGGGYYGGGYVNTPFGTYYSGGAAPSATSPNGSQAYPFWVNNKVQS